MGLCFSCTYIQLPDTCIPWKYNTWNFAWKELSSIIDSANVNISFKPSFFQWIFSTLSPHLEWIPFQDHLFVIVCIATVCSFFKLWYAFSLGWSVKRRLEGLDSTSVLFTVRISTTFKWNHILFIILTSCTSQSCFWLSRWMVWRRQWHPTPVLLPGKSYGQRSLVGCSRWGL